MHVVRNTILKIWNLKYICHYNSPLSPDYLPSNKAFSRLLPPQSHLPAKQTVYGQRKHFQTETLQ